MNNGKQSDRHLFWAGMIIGTGLSFIGSFISGFYFRYVEAPDIQFLIALTFLFFILVIIALISSVYYYIKRPKS
jgi:tellurite resistance protein TehA-like permease